MTISMVGYVREQAEDEADGADCYAEDGEELEMPAK
jgi:hypothetical protein